MGHVVGKMRWGCRRIRIGRNVEIIRACRETTAVSGPPRHARAGKDEEWGGGVGVEWARERRVVDSRVRLKRAVCLCENVL